MAEATLYKDHGAIPWTAAAATTGGTVIQLADGRAAVVAVDLAAAETGAGQDASDIYVVAKTTSMVFLDGGRVYWDYSANKAHYKKVNDRDFYIGRAVGDAASADTTMKVKLNALPQIDIDAIGGEGGYLSVATGTQALGGFLPPQVYGKSRALTLTATSEVQCVDILSVDKFDKAANAIIEAVFRVGANGSTSAVDFNVGIANGTSASDADAVTEHVYAHIDGGDLSVFFQSKDGTTTVSAQDSTVDTTAGSAVTNRAEVWIDTRDPANVKVYLNGAQQVTGSTFKIDAATGPFGLLAHLEKTTGTATAGPIYIDRLEARFAEQ